MDRSGNADHEARFASYVDALVSVIGHADRAGPLEDYCTGLVLPAERKSVEPMAALTAPERTGAQHQKLLHFVGQAPWSDEALLNKVREMVLPVIERHGPIEAWIIDDTGFPKKGRHSVGVTRQWCGQLGKQDNCQVAVSLSIANHHASLPVAFRLYLPQEWTRDHERCSKVGVPDEVTFRTKLEMALDQIRRACEAGIPRATVLMDSAYGSDSGLRTELSALGLPYVAAILSTAVVWPPGMGPLPPKLYVPGFGRPTKRLRRDETHRPVTVKSLALSLPVNAWKNIRWREGSNEPLISRYARLRVRIATRDFDRSEPWPEEWLLIEWPENESEPTKYWLSTLPKTIGFARLVDRAKLRWRIERDYHDLKQEVGLAHFEGRGWRGFHHHASLCIAAYGFLISERETIPPSGSRARATFKKPSVPGGSQPRASAPQNRATCAELNGYNAPAPDCCGGEALETMSMLCRGDQTPPADTTFVTQ